MKIYPGFLQSILLPLFLATCLISAGGCKKEETITTESTKKTLPVFKIVHTYINVGGNDYIQFVTCCTSETVKLDTVTITDPVNKRVVYEYFSDTSDYQIFCKDESFTFPEDFPRQPGIWKFTYVGQRYNDNSDFSAVVNDTIAN
jgi:hypothetical protein